MSFPRFITPARRTEVPARSGNKALVAAKSVMAAAAGITAISSLAMPVAPAQATTATTYDVRGMSTPRAGVVGKEMHISASVTPNAETTQCVVMQVQNPSAPTASRVVATVKNASKQLAPGWPATFYQDWTPTKAGTYTSVASIYDPTCTTLVKSYTTSTFTVSATGTTSTSTAAGTFARPFSASSTWNTALPTTTSYGKINWPAATNQWVYYTNWRDQGSTPVYQATSTDPTVTVTVTSTSNWGRTNAPVTLHIPKGANGARGWYVSSGTGAKWYGDGELTVVDGTTVWQFHQFRRTSDTTATVNVYGKADLSKGTGWGTWAAGSAGTTAAGSSEFAGLLTQADADATTINHALQLVVDYCNNVNGAPVGLAMNADGGRNADGSARAGSGCSGTAQVLLHEGQRLAIPRSVSASSISGLSPLGKKVFAALQTYGAYDIDSSHGPQGLIRMQSNAFNQATQTALQADMAKLLPLLQTVGATTSTTTATTATTSPSTSTTTAATASTSATPSASTTTSTTPTSSATSTTGTVSTMPSTTATSAATATSSAAAVDAAVAANSTTGKVVWRQTGSWTSVTDAAGNVWKARANNVTKGGAQVYSTDAVSGTVAGATDQAIYRNMVNGADSWTVPTGNGTFQVKIFTTETYFGSAGQRVFDVTAEGKTVLSKVDAFAATGAKNKAYEPTFTATVTDGTLNIGFNQIANTADIAAIEVTQVA